MHKLCHVILGVPDIYPSYCWACLCLRYLQSCQHEPNEDIIYTQNAYYGPWLWSITWSRFSVKPLDSLLANKYQVAVTFCLYSSSFASFSISSTSFLCFLCLPFLLISFLKFCFGMLQGCFFLNIYQSGIFTESLLIRGEGAFRFYLWKHYSNSSQCLHHWQFFQSIYHKLGWSLTN